MRIHRNSTRYPSLGKARSKWSQRSDKGRQHVGIELDEKTEGVRKEAIPGLALVLVSLCVQFGIEINYTLFFMEGAVHWGEQSAGLPLSGAGPNEKFLSGARLPPLDGAGPNEKLLSGAGLPPLDGAGLTRRWGTQRKICHPRPFEQRCQTPDLKNGQRLKEQKCGRWPLRYQIEINGAS